MSPNTCARTIICEHPNIPEYWAGIGWSFVFVDFSRHAGISSRLPSYMHCMCWTIQDLGCGHPSPRISKVFTTFCKSVYIFCLPWPLRPVQPAKCAYHPPLLFLLRKTVRNGVQISDFLLCDTQLGRPTEAWICWIVNNAKTLSASAPISQLKATDTKVFISNCREAFIFTNHSAVSAEFKTTPFGRNRYEFKRCHN